MKIFFLAVKGSFCRIFLNIKRWLVLDYLNDKLDFYVYIRLVPIKDYLIFSHESLTEPKQVRLQ